MSVSTSSPRRLRGTGGWRGLWLIEHFNVATKLLILGAILLIPVVLSLYFLGRTNWERQVEFGRREQKGHELITKVDKLITELEGSRFTAASYTAGDKDALDNLKSGNQTIDGDIKAIDEPSSVANLQYLGLSESWNEVKKAVEDIIGHDANVGFTADQCAQKYSTTLDQVQVFNRLLGDKSGLTLDPQVDTHYAIDIFLTRIPEMEQDMGKACALLARLAAEKSKPSPAQREDLSRYSAILAYQSEQMNRSYEKLITERANAFPNGDPLGLKAQLDPFLADARKGIAEFTKYMDNVSIGTAKVDDWTSAAADGITNLTTFSESFLPGVGKILDARIQTAQKDIISVGALVVLGVIMTVLIGFYIVSDINRPLRATLAVANSIAKGDINFTIPEVDRRDEFGNLNRALRAMVSNLQEILNSIGTTVQTLTAATSEIMTTTSELAVSSTQMATAVNEATTTVEEVKQTAQISSQRAQQVAQSAQQAAQVSQAGRQATDETLEEMNRIKEQMLSIAESIVRLSEQTQAISEIIASVNDLAEQSNLLAVNASIEAAKAGEQGRGFAVVAQEVRHLAEQSKQSTAQVRNILSDIQKATGGAVMVAEQGTKAVELGVRQSKEAGDSIKTLATRVVEAAQAAVQISASTHQQLVGMDQVVTAMMGIKDGSVQTAASMRNVQTSAQRLYEMTQNLKKLTERYSSN